MLHLEFETLEKDRTLLTHPREGPFPKGKADPPVGVNLSRLIKSAQRSYHLDPAKPSSLSPVEVVCKVQELLTHLHVVKGIDTLSVEAQENATVNFFALIRSTLASKRTRTPSLIMPHSSAQNAPPCELLRRCAVRTQALPRRIRLAAWRDQGTFPL